MTVLYTAVAFFLFYMIFSIQFFLLHLLFQLPNPNPALDALLLIILTMPLRTLQGLLDELTLTSKVQPIRILSPV